MVGPAFVKSEKGSNLNGVTMQRKAVTLQTGVEDKTVDDEWNPQGGVRETLPDQQDLWIGCSGFVFSGSAQRYRQPFRIGTKRSVEQHQLHEQGLRLEDQAFRRERRLDQQVRGVDQTSCASAT